MKKIKLVLALAFLFAISSNVASAQATDKKAEMKEQMKAAKEKLALTAEQEPKFMEISKKYALKMKEVKDGNQNKREKFKAIKEIQSQKNEEIKVVLSEEQFKTYLQMQEERKAMMKERREE
jgi:lipopolysaccharide export LptBFGC system permease protein LptF